MQYMLILGLVLIKAGVQVNAQAEWGFTPVHHAVKYTQPTHSIDLLKLLTQAGADINKQAKECGNTPLHMAIEGRKWHVCAYLMHNNASAVLEIQNNDRMCPLELLRDGDRQHLPYTVTADAMLLTSCWYSPYIQAFKKSLKLEDTFFEPAWDMCYCQFCHVNSGDADYYSGGKPPKKFTLPIGWYNFALKLPPRVVPMSVREDWHQAYHGTTREALANILKVSEIVPAGREIIGKQDGPVTERDKHFNKDWKPKGFDTKQIFVTPSINYAGLEAYAKSFSYSIDGTTFKAQCVFQMYIHPDSYTVGKKTVKKDHICPVIPDNELEWSTRQQGSNVLAGLLVKLTKQ